MNWIIRLWNALKRWFGFGSDESFSQPNTTISRIAPAEPQFDLTTKEAPQYQTRVSLFTYQEKKFFRALRSAVNKKYEIFPKVRLGDFVFLANEPEDRKYHNNQIQCKHIDYLLCEKFDFKPVLVIELDDSSHNRLERRLSDEFKSSLFEGIKLPLLRFTIETSYSPAEIAEKIGFRLHPPSNPTEIP